MIKLISMGLATWRMSRMFYDLEEDGPFDVLHRIRMKAGIWSTLEPDTMAGRAITCPYCVSWWVGLLFATLYIVSPKLAFIASLPFSLSAVVILMYEHIDPELPPPENYPPSRLLD